MHLCYIDEAGNGQTLDPARPDAPPVLVVGGFTVPRSQVKALTWDFLKVKKHYRPQLQRATFLSEVIQHEVKGSDVRKNIRVGNHSWRRAAFDLLGSLLDILRQHDARVLARVWVKEEGCAFDETGVYSSSVSALTETFQAQLAHEHSRGMMVLDSRTKSKNAPNVHCVTTRKYRTGGDGYRGIIESPVFGHSDTHTLLQLADLVVSSLLFPIACHAYTSDLTWNVHCDDAYAGLRSTFGDQLRKLQFRYRDPVGKWRGGIVVSDRRSAQSSSLMFRLGKPAARPLVPQQLPPRTDLPTGYQDPAEPR
ncbi:Protein of unknown function [Streptomyces sp. WMMB 714]|uniref:DUF3800 domain-containing protein n=1 Tax=Streptomyces sp. WMMB 714 TaxID=1286822 RepID=UPI0005F7D3C7|nr:DUF3800 domain-containing protein [Streptomyces sp. WMMB 714]SCK36129.1 Protein of unknown function [Streptomyces sp. WMMB 714]